MRQTLNIALAAALLAAGLAAPALADTPPARPAGGVTVTAPMPAPAPRNLLAPLLDTPREYAAVADMAARLQAVEGAVHPGEDGLAAGNSIIH